MNPALKKKLYHYAMVTLACAIMGIAMNTFYMPNKMLSGGIGGVAVLALLCCRPADGRYQLNLQRAAVLFGL